jgi:hypothetical protein
MPDTKIPITNINDISAESDYQDPYKTNIPNKFKERISSLIEDMENELNDIYYISIRKPGYNSTEIYPLEERKRSYEIIMKNAKDIPKTYSVYGNVNLNILNGVYPSLNAIRERIYDIYIESIKSVVPIEKINGQYVWRCPKCLSYGFTNTYEDNGKIIKFNLINNILIGTDSKVVCRNCNFDPEFPRSIWRVLELYPSSGLVGVDSGCSLSIIDNLGILKIIR